MSRPKVTWNGPTKTVANRVPVRHSLKRKPATISGVEKMPKGKLPVTAAGGGFWYRLGQPRKGLRQVSARRKRELKEYSERRKLFLARSENRWCPVMLMFPQLPRKVRTTDIHHLRGREGKLLNDERYWLAVSRPGHDWIHANPNLAREMGWII